jgi:hypothetical protein
LGGYTHSIYRPGCEIWVTLLSTTYQNWLVAIDKNKRIASLTPITDSLFISMYGSNI